jgi:hypothetical protein
MYGDFSSSQLRPVTKKEFHYLNQLLYNLNGAARLPTQYSNAFLFFRNLAFQQFWLQEPFNAQRIARQCILFGKLEDNHPFKKMFLDETGICIDDFLELSLMLLTRVFQHPPVFTEDWFASIKNSFEEDTVRNFLDSISLDVASAKEYLASQKRENISYEFYEQSPLKRYPLLRHSDSFLFYSRNLLFHALQTFIYDILRSPDPNAFMDKFGLIFENYVENAIQYTKLPYLNETNLRVLSNDKKSVDFLIIDNNVNVLIDAKGVEMNYLGMVSHIPEVIRHKTKSSISKGIQQGYETAKLLSTRTEVNGHIIGKEKNYLLIVTFKDLFVGNGQDFQDHIAAESFSAMKSKYDGDNLIPAENMYFISIDDLDLLVECLRQGNTLSEILQKIVISDQNLKSKKFVFRQHLHDMYPDLVKVPDYLSNEYSKLIQKSGERFPDKQVQKS